MYVCAHVYIHIYVHMYVHFYTCISLPLFSLSLSLSFCSFLSLPPSLTPVDSYGSP